MTTLQENRLLTEVEGDTPMGQLMRRNYWIPCALSETLVADGAPRAIRLLGDRYVAFRATDGRIGFFDEACPHRGVSLTLARNEDCALRCIFHAWKFDVSGRVIEVPSEGARSASFASKIVLNHYPTFEAGGLLWVFLGDGPPPPRPPLPFLDLPTDHIVITRSIAPCNWLQGVEGTLDSVHVGTLHQSWMARPKDAGGAAAKPLTLENQLRYEVEDTPYGIRAAALRPAGDRQYVRVSEYVMPFTTLVPGSGKRAGSMFIAVPIDNVSHMLFWGLWDEDGRSAYLAAEPGLRTEARDIDNYALIGGDASSAWGQNRAAMANGHFSGFDGCLLDEDMVVQASMGLIVDRGKEQLCASDVGLVRARRRLLREIAAMDRGERTTWEGGMVRPLDTVADAGFQWREPA